MDLTAGRVFLDFSARKLEQLSQRVLHCLGKLDQVQVWSRGGGNENAVGNLVLHLCGNVRQWIGSGVDGRPDVRNRDREFAARGVPGPDAIAALLKESVEDACRVLRGLPEPRLLDCMTVQGYTLTVLEGIYHVVEHFSHHAGQILYATKQMTGAGLGFYGHLSRPGGHGERTP